MLTCKQVTELVTDYLEGRMSFGQRVRLQLHLGMCHRCRAYLSQMKMTVRVLGKMPDEPLPPDLRDELLARFRASRPAVPAAAARSSPVSVLDGWIGSARGWLVALGLVAVAIVLALLAGGQPGPLAVMSERCLVTELGAGLLPVAALGVAAAFTRARPSAGSLAAVAAAGAFVGYLWLHQSCPHARVLSHVLVAHVGAMALSVLLGAAASWLPRPRRLS